MRALRWRAPRVRTFCCWHRSAYCSGSSIAARQSLAPGPLELMLVLAGGVLAHGTVNLLNEYEDFRSGLDLMTRRTPFSGGSGALPEAPAAASSVLITALGMLVGVVAIGGYFLWLRGWPMLLLGLSGMLLMMAYTRWITHSAWVCLLAPGLGFGPVMVLGSPDRAGRTCRCMALLGAMVALLLVSELLLINQFPDSRGRSAYRASPSTHRAGIATRFAVGGGAVAGRLCADRAGAGQPTLSGGNLADLADVSGGAVGGPAPARGAGAIPRP